MDYYSVEVRRRWQHAAKAIAEAAGRPVRKLTAENWRETPQVMPRMRLVSVEFEDGEIITCADANDRLAADLGGEVEDAIKALAPTIRLRGGMLYARAIWTVEQKPPGRRTAFGDLI